VYILFKRIPAKSSELIQFLFKNLTSEGTKGWKEALVETMMKIALEGS